MPRAAGVVLVLVTLLLAGCLSPNDAPTPARQICDNRTSTSCPPAPPAPGTTPRPLSPAENASFGAQPVWNVGDWWSIKTSGGPGFTAVVASVGTGYELLPADNNTALAEALFDFSTLGMMGSDLSGSQGGGRVKFFDFPLEENKTWGFTIDGRSLRAMAKIDKNEWRITATDGNSTQMVYTYSPTVKWFTSIDWKYLGFTATLDRSGTDYRGDLYTASLSPLMSYATGGAPAGSFSVTPGTSAVAVNSVWTGNQGFAASARIVDPKNTANVPFADVTCTGPCQGQTLAVYGATPGTWAATISSTAQGTLDVDVYAVTDRVRRI